MWEILEAFMGAPMDYKKEGLDLVEKQHTR